MFLPRFIDDLDTSSSDFRFRPLVLQGYFGIYNVAINFFKIVLIRFGKVALRRR